MESHFTCIKVNTGTSQEKRHTISMIAGFVNRLPKSSPPKFGTPRGKKLQRKGYFDLRSNHSVAFGD